MRVDKQLSAAASKIARKPLTVEHRPEHGWYIVERGMTLVGFQTRALLKAYLERVVKRGGGLYTPSASETYGRG
jgi:hypothetical protein